ncbi:MAG: MnhB domain-containing protein [Pseudomonadota bacterium]
MTKYASLVFISGLTFLLMIITAQLPLGEAPMVVGKAILASAVEETGAANIVTSVVLAYRGLDTLGELSILFTAAAAITLILPTKTYTISSATQTIVDENDSGFIVTNAVALLFPLLLMVGFSIIFHGHLTPGGGFQGGVILAIAFFMLNLADPKKNIMDHHKVALIESFSGFSFIAIGLFALFSGKSFLEPLFFLKELGQSSGQEQLGSLWSAGTLPILYIAVGLKVGAELAGLLNTLFFDQADSEQTEQLAEDKS